MSDRFDPFAALGLQRNASMEEVRHAYRRLAMRWHPDRNASTAAEAQFKHIKAAYELILDPARLAEWQREEGEQQREAARQKKARTAEESKAREKKPRSRSKAGASAAEEAAAAEAAAASGARGASAAEASNAGEEPAPGRQDIVQTLTLSLEEAAQGCVRNLDLARSARCGDCGGRGRVERMRSVPCGQCNGCGRTRGGRLGTTVCPGCDGRGYMRETACESCAGNGVQVQTRTLAVKVPPGLLNGERLRLARQGEGGDLYLAINLAPHPLFRLQGRDLHCTVPVSVYRLLAGGGIEVPTLSGITRLALTPGGGLADKEQRLPGLGFPKPLGKGAGDLVLRLKPVFPANVSPGDRVLLERLQAAQEARPESWPEELREWSYKVRG